MNEKNKTIIGIGLIFCIFIIIKLFLSGISLDYFWNEIFSILIILFFLCFIFMFVPFIFRCKNKKKLEFKKGQIISILNSFILFILFAIPNLITILNQSKSNNINDIQIMTINPIDFSKSLILIFCIISIIFYFINLCFFVDSKK